MTADGAWMACLGTAKVAVLKGRRVVRQGTFAGAQEVKA
jgi:hypothetical protein